MKNKVKIAPSLLSANFANLEKSIRLCEENNVDIIHLDIMDGHFVPNITFGPIVVGAIGKLTELPLDCHLMITNPDKYIPDFVEAGSDMISLHVETGYHLHRSLSTIKNFGKLAGIALNPATPLEFAFEAAEFCDFILLMSVNPGFGGQSFIPSFLRRCDTLRNFLDKNNLHNVEIQVDGGITPKNVKDVVSAGANIIVAGSALFNGDFKKNIDEFRKNIV